MPTPAAMTVGAVGFEPVSWSSIGGWAVDDHAAAYQAWTKCRGRIGRSPPQALAALFDAAPAEGVTPSAPSSARAFFERRFRPYQVVHGEAPGLLTGYYEPEIEGRATPEPGFEVPLYRRPPDLVNLVDETERGAPGIALTHARCTPSGNQPYATRAEIEQGALAGQGLELVYLADPVDAFLMQVQGSGLIRLPGGQTMRLGYDGKNGYPYTSIGRHLVDTGEITAAAMSLATLAAWLRADPERGRRTMWRNASFVFFRVLMGVEASAGPQGANGIPLTEGRSLAVDASVHAIGTPIWVHAPGMAHIGAQGLRRLMIAQDVGSAIRGPERGDVFFGAGEAAGHLAGITKHPVTFTVLLPLAEAGP